jgi:hypothetical protein
MRLGLSFKRQTWKNHKEKFQTIKKLKIKITIIKTMRTKQYTKIIERKGLNWKINKWRKRLKKKAIRKWGPKLETK